MVPSRDLNKMTVNELLDTWLETKKSKAFRTVESYESVTRLHLRPALGHLAVRGTRRSDIEKAIVVWTTGPRADGKSGKRGNTTIRQCITYIYGAFKLAKDDGIRSDNPVEGIRRPQLVKPKKRFVLKDGALNILEALTGTTFHAPVFIAFVLGLRPCELLALRRRDADLHAGTVSVLSSLEYRGKHLMRKEPKTEKGKRELPIAELTLSVLQDCLEQQERRLYALNVAVGPDTPIFDDGQGNIWHPDNFRTAFQRFIRAAELPTFQWRSTRHSFASMGVKEKVHTKVLAEILGHEDDRLTSTIYQQVDRDTMLDANRMVANALADGVPH
jgi:integrase